VLAFTFLENPVTGRLLLLEELWQEVKPGLSAFADNPAAGAATIRTLLEEAKAIVPPHLRSRTPVSLKATAGLRLLPAHQSEALIEAVSLVLADSGFDNRGVEIMSELHEGLFGWVTVNYLLDQLHNPRYR
jgi:ectonucleoside triphosphate diphosphohydrolase 5/6